MTQKDYTSQLTAKIILHGEHSPETVEFKTIGIIEYGMDKFKELYKTAKRNAINAMP